MWFFCSSTDFSSRCLAQAVEWGDVVVLVHLKVRASASAPDPFSGLPCLSLSAGPPDGWLLARVHPAEVPVGDECESRESWPGCFLPVPLTWNLPSGSGCFLCDCSFSCRSSPSSTAHFPRASVAPASPSVRPTCNSFPPLKSLGGLHIPCPFPPFLPMPLY